jgi:hypothetical protein
MKKLLSFLGLLVILTGCSLWQFDSKPSADNTNQLLIGGDKDAGGCLIAAGYSWCEPKQKCLRTWEEKCYETEEAGLAKIFAERNKKSVEETQVTIMTLKNNFASGTISFGLTPGEGGVFLVRLVDNQWLIDYEGNGSIDCAKIRALDYPEEVLAGFCDTACTQEAKLCADGSYVSRTGPNCEFAPCPGEAETGGSVLTDIEARAIAEQACIKGGEALKNGFYNEVTKTWWFDANLNATKEGCNPACVVDEKTRTAEINWRCTGLIEPNK